MSLSDATSPATVTFEDALGTRVHLQPVGGGPALDLLWFNDRVASVPSFEFALRERVGSVDQFRDVHFAAIKGVDRNSSTRMRLVLISEHAAGLRLSQLIGEAERRQLRLDVTTALSVMRHLAAAIAMLHEQASGVAHGAIGPDRIVITPNGRLILVEHVLGSALEQLQYSPARYWRELGIAMPPAAGARIDQRTDVFQAGSVLLSLLLSRTLDRRREPGALKHLIPTAINRPDLQPFNTLRIGLDQWLERALQVNPADGFASGLDAWAALDEVLGSASLSLPGAIHISLPLAGSTDQPPATATPRARSSQPASDVQMMRSSEARLEIRERTNASRRPPAVDVRPALALRVSPSESLTRPPREPMTSLSLRPALLDVLPAPAPIVEVEDVPYTIADEGELGSGSWRQLAASAAAVAVCAAIGTAGFYAAHRHKPADGTVTLITNPAGARAVIDGTARGVTPLTVALAAGKHTVELREGGATRTIPLSVASGADVSQYVDLPPRPSQRGELEVRTDPTGAHVSVDDVSIGDSPMRLDLDAGPHRVVVERNGVKAAQEVTIQPSMNASLLVPLVSSSVAPQFGWISVKAPVDVQLYEHGQLVGTSQSARLMMTAGPHEVQIVNDVLGYRATRALQIAPGKVTDVAVDFPLGSVDLSTTPPADVWVDGQRVGATPIANLPVPLGPHEILFRNPQLGDRHYAVTVTEAKPVRLDVDLNKQNF